jgi:hypothetical protein
MALVDLDLYGRTDVFGNPTEHTEEMAVSNALLHFIQIRKGEYIEEPNLGGIVEFLKFKSMNTVNPDEVSKILRLNLEFSFRGIIEVSDVIVNPNFEKQRWEIAIAYIYLKNNTENGLQFNVDKATNNKSENVILASMDIPLIGENLYATLVTLADSQNALLSYESRGDYYYWGKYKLSGLKNTDPYYSDIQALLN